MLETNSYEIFTKHIAIFSSVLPKEKIILVIKLIKLLKLDKNKSGRYNQIMKEITKHII